jgi:wyosine [tRNA(Phe)-imidazoG37] synthetase (radical SAM superfamily)
VTDNPNFDNVDVRTILSIFDRIVVRLEAGTAKTYAAITGKKSGDYATFVSQLPASEKLTIQARFYKGEVDNTADAEVKAWVKKLGELKPREVYLLNPEAKPTNKKLKPAPKARISEIGKELTEKTGIQAVILSTPSVLG